MLIIGRKNVSFYLIALLLNEIMTINRAYAKLESLLTPKLESLLTPNLESLLTPKLEEKVIYSKINCANIRKQCLPLILV